MYFANEFRYSEEYRGKLQKARKQGIEALRNLIKGEEIKALEAGVIIDIFLSYRDLSKSKEEWEEMAMFVNKMPQELANTVMVQEQLGFALNRAGKRDEQKVYS